MKLLVYEELCGSGMVSRGEVSASLLAEGKALLGCLLQDLAASPEFEILTVLDPAVTLGIHPRITVVPPAAWPGIIDEVEAVWVIAPETAGILAERCRQVEAKRRLLIGPSSEQVETWSDKLRSAAALRLLGVPTQSWSEATFTGDRMLKPIDGVGCLNTGWLSDGVDIPPWFEETTEPIDRSRWVVQPHCRGFIGSIAIITSLAGDPTIMPYCGQTVAVDEQGRFSYLGGRLGRHCDSDEVARQLAEAFLDHVEPHVGYISLDVSLMPGAERAGDRIIDVYPRLTPLYFVYRHLFGSQMVRWLLLNEDPDMMPVDVAVVQRWMQHSRIDFDPFGQVTSPFKV